MGHEGWKAYPFSIPIIPNLEIEPVLLGLEQFPSKVLSLISLNPHGLGSLDVIKLLYNAVLNPTDS